MAKANLLDVPITKGTFEIKGKLFNVKGESAFKVNDAQTWRTVNLGLRVNDGEVVFFTIKGGQKKTAWMSKRGENKGDKGQTKEVAWELRKKEAKNGWGVMGVSLGLEKDDADFADVTAGKISAAEFYGKKNHLTSLSEWDAHDYLKDHAVDGMDVFVGGDIEYSTYTKEGTTEVQHYRNLVAKKIYLSGAPIDFSAENYKSLADFHQNAIFNGKTEVDGVFSLDLGIVGWHSYETVSIQTTEKLLLDMKAAKIKVGSSMTFEGNFISGQVVDDVPANVLGEQTTAKRANNSGKALMLITSADGNSIETENFTAKKMEAYVLALAEEKAEKASKADSFNSQAGGTLGSKTASKSTDEGEDW